LCYDPLKFILRFSGLFPPAINDFRDPNYTGGLFAACWLGWLAAWLAGCLLAWQPGWLASWLTDRLPGRLLACKHCWLAEWLAAWPGTKINLITLFNVIN